MDNDTSLYFNCNCYSIICIIIFNDEFVDPSLTIKVTGHQWYWSYEYTDYENEKIMFDSYMIPEEDLQNGDLRLLEVDKNYGCQFIHM